jgi:hypothetical protein
VKPAGISVIKKTEYLNDKINEHIRDLFKEINSFNNYVYVAVSSPECRAKL